MDCEKAKNYMAEYIGQDMDGNIKEEVDRHLSSCDSCFKEIKKLDNITWQLECDSRSVRTPVDFLQGMEERAVCDIKPHISIPRWVVKTSLAAVTLAALVISFILFVPQNIKYMVYNNATLGKVYSTEYGSFGRRLNVSSTSNNIKITVMKVAADDLQTIIFLKMEGSTANGCVIYDNDVFINGDRQGDVVRGTVENTGNCSATMILSPIETDRQTLHITIYALHRVSNKDSEKVGGTWSFAVPVEKFKSKAYSIEKTINLGEDNICFKRLIVSSTCTRIEYYFPDRKYIQTMEMEVTNGKKKYNMMRTSSGGNGGYDAADFETIYPDNPENLKINVKEYDKDIVLKDTIVVTVNMKGKFPVEFDYMGNTIKIDNIKVNGSIVHFDLIEPDRPRNYTCLSIGAGSNVFMSMDTIDYLVVDENNRVYDYDDFLKNYQKYKDKSIILYPIKTVISIEYPPGFKNQFKLYVVGSQNIIRANKSVTLK